jgi:hypothetical protein
MRSAAALTVVTLVALAAMAPVAHGQGATLEPGNWMFSIQSVTNGRPDAPLQGEDCLENQLKDLGTYFAPKLDGADAQCETARKPDGGKTMEYVMKCRGAGFTAVATTRITIEDSRRVTLRSLVETKTMQGESRVVSSGEALRTGACRKRR